MGRKQPGKSRPIFPSSLPMISVRARSWGSEVRVQSGFCSLRICPCDLTCRELERASACKREREQQSCLQHSYRDVETEALMEAVPGRAWARTGCALSQEARRCCKSGREAWFRMMARHEARDWGSCRHSWAAGRGRAWPVSSPTWRLSL